MVRGGGPRLGRAKRFACVLRSDLLLGDFRQPAIIWGAASCSIVLRGRQGDGSISINSYGKYSSFLGLKEGLGVFEGGWSHLEFFAGILRARRARAGPVNRPPGVGWWQGAQRA